MIDSTLPRRAMRIWVDLTNSPHVLVMRPVIERLRADGHDVRVTARDFAQTIELCERFEHRAHVEIGRHRGERVAAKAAGLASRSTALVRWARLVRAPAARFDIALGHGSNDVTVAAALLRVPSATMFDYEWATVQHNVNCRLARAVVVPDGDPRAAPGTLRRARQDPRLCGTQGGVLPRRLRARPGGARRSSALDPAAPDRRGAHAARGLAVSPLRERPVRVGARRACAPQPCRTACSRSCCRASTASAPQLARLPGLRRARARDRRAVADRLRRSGDLGRRHDEPRGGRAGNARIHDVRGPAGRGGRASDRRRTPAPAGRRRA